MLTEFKHIDHYTKWALANHPIKMPDENARFNACCLQEVHLDQTYQCQIISNY